MGLTKDEQKQYDIINGVLQDATFIQKIGVILRLMFIGIMFRLTGISLK